MKILISHVYSSHNAGDAAILSAQISELKRVFHHPELSVLSVDNIRADYKFDGVPVVKALMYGAVSPSNHKLTKLLLAWSMMAYTVLWVITLRLTRLALPLPRAWRQPLRLLAAADLQVCVGGGYLRAKDDHSSTVILLLLFHQIWLAKLLKKPVYLYAQSFGPYPKKIQRRIAVAGLRRVDLILVREARSAQLLAGLGLTAPLITQVPDSAFLFKPPRQPRPSQLVGPTTGSQVVGLTVRAWLPPAAQAEYEQAMAGFISRITRSGDLNVVVIAQVTSEHHDDDDRLVGQRLARLLKGNEQVTFLERLDYRAIKLVITDLDYLVGTRFHSVIFALSAGVPVIAIEYEHKTSGIMQDLGLEKWVIDMEDVTTDGLARLFAHLVEQRQAYVRQLQTVIPAYVDKAHRAAEIIKQAYERSSADDAESPRPQK